VDGRPLLTVSELVQSMLKYASKNSNVPFVSHVCGPILVILILVIQPIVNRNNDSIHGWSVVYDITATLVLVPFVLVNVAFLSAGYTDLQCRCSASNFLAKLIRVENVHLHGDKGIPRLELNSGPMNAFAWLCARLVFQNFGKRVLFRIDCYTGSYILMPLILSAILIHNILIADDAFLELERAINLQILVIVIMSFLLVAKHIMLAAEVNEMFFSHAEILTMNGKLPSISAFLIDLLNCSFLAA
jgi:hypothetical protein